MASNKNAFNFTGKVALITGGAAGIGRATSLHFPRQGAKVVIGDIDPAGVETANLIKREGGEAIFVQTDVREKEVENLVAMAVETYGELHCAFNNAGILPQPYRSLKLTPQPPVKSAILAIDPTVCHYFQLHAIITQESPISVRIFQQREDAAKWLGVALERLAERPRERSNQTEGDALLTNDETST